MNSKGRIMKRSLRWLASIYLVCCSQASTQTPARPHSLIELRAVRDRSSAGYSVKKSLDDTSFYLSDRSVVSDDDIAEASTDTSAANGLVLRMRLKPSAASDMVRLPITMLLPRTGVLAGTAGSAPGAIAARDGGSAAV